MEELLLMDLPECKLKEEMQSFGLEEEEMSNQVAMCVSVLKQSLAGNLKAFQLIRDQIDQNPKDRCY